MGEFDIGRLQFQFMVFKKLDELMDIPVVSFNGV
jgi:hypothetical protein